MNKILFVFIILSITLLSCNGKKSKHEALKESIEKFKDSLVITEYIPNEYSEIIRDSILSNGFSINIKTYTDMENSVPHKYKTDSNIVHIDIYRNWISEVKVKKEGKLIFNEIINNDFFLKNNTKIDYPDEVVNMGTVFDQELSIEKDYIYLYTEFTYPDVEGGFLYILEIDRKGAYTLKKLATS